MSYAQTMPYFAIVAMALTMVIVAGDIDLSFRSVMALGMVGFVWIWDATENVLLAAFVSLGRSAPVLACSMALSSRIIGLPSLVVTIGTQFLFRGLVLVLVARQSFALARLAVTYPRCPRGQAIPGDSRWSSGGWSLVTVVACLLLNRHRLGQNTYVVGDNKQAAGLMGIAHPAHPHHRSSP